MMIIIGHRKNYLNPSWSNWSALQQVVMKFFSSYAYCVVSFFACSGVLIAQSTLKALKQLIIRNINRHKLDLPILEAP